MAIKMVKDQKKQLKFAAYFPELYNYHLIKDKMPYILFRDFGYRSYIFTHKWEEYPDLNTEVKGLKLIFLPYFQFPFVKKTKKIQFHTIFRRAPSFLRDLLYFIRLFPKIDVIQIFHLKIESMLIGLLFRVLNPKGVSILKLDERPDIIEMFEKNPKTLARARRLYSLFKLCRFDIVSAENPRLVHFLKEKHPLFQQFKENICYIPNGLDLQQYNNSDLNYSEKSNIILHVGRFNLYQKRTDIMLEAFTSIMNEFPDWKLLFIGLATDTKCDDLIKAYTKKYPQRISFLPFMRINELISHYKSSKILAMPSSFESFGMVAIESGFYGMILVGTNIQTLKDITNEGKLAYLCNPDDFKAFTENLRFALQHEQEFQGKSRAFINFIKKNFDWSRIAQNLDHNIKRVLSHR